MHAVGYCRTDLVSAGAATDLADQRELISAEAARRDWTLIDIFHDIGPAHSLTAREGLHRALAVVESRQARAIIVTDMTRLSTTFEGVAWLVHASRRRSWALVSIADQSNDDRKTALPSLSFADAMAPAIAYVTFDCEEPDALATFWAAATGFRKESSPDPRTYAAVSDMAGRGPALWFNKVPEPKVVKNRLHICLNTQSLPAEIEKLTSLGARHSATHSSPSGKTWAIMLDPEGNEFCVIPASRRRPAAS
jgi:predicted enzyme related to lactoylglutathione lyase